MVSLNFQGAGPENKSTFHQICQSLVVSVCIKLQCTQHHLWTVATIFPYFTCGTRMCDGKWNWLVGWSSISPSFESFPFLHLTSRYLSTTCTDYQTDHLFYIFRFNRRKFRLWFLSWHAWISYRVDRVLFHFHRFSETCRLRMKKINLARVIWCSCFLLILDRRYR